MRKVVGDGGNGDTKEEELETKGKTLSKDQPVGGDSDIPCCGIGDKRKVGVLRGLG